MDELSLCLVTDRAQTRGRDLVTVVRECLAAGLPAVQVREKDLGAGDLAALCRQIRGATREHGAQLVVNDRVDVALAVGADAVQRTHTSLTVNDIRAVAGPRLRIGASVHSLDDARAAEAAGADWVVFGPVYDTASKRQYGAPQGLERLAAVTRARGNSRRRDRRDHARASGRSARGRRARRRRHLGNPVRRLPRRSHPHLPESAGLT